jgi:hypothetical protein
MKRSKTENKEAILWKKEGGGSFHANIQGRLQIIKPGQEFYAREDEIPPSFRDTIKPVDPTGKQVTVKQAEQKEKKEETKAAPKYELRHRGGGWWNVVNEDGKVINEKALKKEEAEELLTDLTAG